RREIAGARWKNNLLRKNLEREPAAVHLERKPGPQALRLPCQVTSNTRMIHIGRNSALLNFLKGGDLRHIDKIAEFDAIVIHTNGCIVTDGEVSQRVCRRGARSKERNGHDP